MKNDRKYYVENIVKARRYLLASIMLAAAGAVYEVFSHGVYSYYMIYAFMIPLVLGCLPYLADSRGFFKTAGPLAEGLLMAAIVTLSAGSVIKGILEIYGTTNRLTIVYVAASMPLLLISIIIGIIKSRKLAKKVKKTH